MAQESEVDGKLLAKPPIRLYLRPMKFSPLKQHSHETDHLTEMEVEKT